MSNRATNRWNQTQESTGKVTRKGEQLTLDEVIDITRTYKATQSQMEELDGESNKDIHGIKGDENESENMAKKCPNCGLNHPLQARKKCPAYGSVCLNCQKENHWTRVCRSRNQGGTRGRQRNRKNPRSCHHSRSKDRHNRRRSVSAKRRDGDRRELSNQFETITFESITVDVIGPQAQPANEVFKPIKNKDDLVIRYLDCFKVVGKFQGQYHITVDPLYPRLSMLKDVCH